MSYIDQIQALGACPEAVNWLRKEDYSTFDAAWAACPRGDRMLWLVARLAGPPGDSSRIPLVLAACACAELSLCFVPEEETRPRRVIEITRAWTRGAATLDEVRMATVEARAVCAGDTALTAASQRAAARATVYAGNAVYAAAYAATYATEASNVAVNAAYSVARNTSGLHATFNCTYANPYAGARAYAAVVDATFGVTLAHYADIVRQYFPNPPELSALVTR